MELIFISRDHNIFDDSDNYYYQVCVEEDFTYIKYFEKNQESKKFKLNQEFMFPTSFSPAIADIIKEEVKRQGLED